MGDIEYNFVASGHADVTNVFRSVTYEAQRMARESSAAFQQVNAGMRSLTRSTGGTGISRGGFSQAERDARAMARSDAQRERSRKAALDKEGRELEAYGRKLERELQKQTAAEQRELAKRERLREQSTKRQAMADEKVRKERLQTLTRLGSGLAWGAAGAVAAVGGAALGGALAMTGSGLRDAVSLDDAVRRLAINSRGAGQVMEDPTKLRQRIQDMARMTPGIRAADIAETMSGFVGKTGDLNTAMRLGGTFATAASASGASVQDIGTAAADLTKKFGITDQAEMQDALAALIFQGKAGSFELKDAAAQYAKLAAAAGSFGMDKGVKGVRTLGGLTQIAREATGSPEQAATAIEATMRQLVGESGTIKRLTGVDVFTDKSRTKARDIAQLLPEIIAGAKGDQVKLKEIFGEEGKRGINPLISAYNQAGGGAKGEAAVRQQLDQAINAVGDWSEVQEDAAAAQESTSARLTAAWESLVSKVSESVLPAFTSFVEQMSEQDMAGTLEAFMDGLAACIEGLGSFVQFLEEHGLIEKRVQGDGAAEKKAEKKAEKERERAEKEVTKAEQKLEKFDKTLRSTDFDKEGNVVGKAGMKRKEFVDRLQKSRGNLSAAEEAEMKAELAITNLKKPVDALTPKNEEPEIPGGIFVGPNGGYSGKNDFLNKLAGESDEERILRQNRAAAEEQERQQREREGVGGTNAGVEGVRRGHGEAGVTGRALDSSNLQKLMDAAFQAAEALNKVKASEGGSIHPAQ